MQNDLKKDKFIRFIHKADGGKWQDGKLNLFMTDTDTADYYLTGHVC